MDASLTCISEGDLFGIMDTDGGGGCSVLKVTLRWNVRKAGSGRKNRSLFKKPADPHRTKAHCLRYCFSSGNLFMASSVRSSRMRKMSLLVSRLRALRRGILTCVHSASR